MSQPDIWMDNILDRSEKQEILEKIEVSIALLKDLKVNEALDVLIELQNELDDYVGDNVKQVKKSFEQKDEEHVAEGLRELRKEIQRLEKQHISNEIQKLISKEEYLKAIME